jgi:hypothetical protein
MTRKSKRELERAVESLRQETEPSPTSVVVVAGNAGEWPDGVDQSDITVTRQEPGIDPELPVAVEEVCTPIHRPPEHRGGVVVMSEKEIAQVYAAMPEDVREAERELRAERGEPIPPILEGAGA